jgi:hypothetical protein
MAEPPGERRQQQEGQRRHHEPNGAPAGGGEDRGRQEAIQEDAIAGAAGDQAEGHAAMALGHRRLDDLRHRRPAETRRTCQDEQAGHQQRHRAHQGQAG